MKSMVLVYEWGSFSESGIIGQTLGVLSRGRLSSQMVWRWAIHVYTNIFIPCIELLSVQARRKPKLPEIAWPVAVGPRREITNCGSNVVLCLKNTHHIFHEMEGMLFQGDWWHEMGPLVASRRTGVRTLVTEFLGIGNITYAQNILEPLKSLWDRPEHCVAFSSGFSLLTQFIRGGR